MRSLTAYRVMANVVGVLLLILVFVGLPLKYLASKDQVVAVVGTAHGFLYILYLLVAGNLAYQRRWPLPRTALVLLAGTVPFLSFAVEHRMTRLVRAEMLPVSSGS